LDNTLQEKDSLLQREMLFKWRDEQEWDELMAKIDAIITQKNRLFYNNKSKYVFIFDGYY